MDKHIPIVPPSPGAESEADRIKKEWETKNKVVTEVLQRERMASFKFGGASTDVRTDTSIQSSFQHIANLSSSSTADSSLNRTSISGAENDDGLPQSLSLLITTGIDSLICPLPPSPSSSKFQIQTQTDALSLKLDENTVIGSGACTPRPVPDHSAKPSVAVLFPSSPQDEESPSVVAPVISLTPVQQQQDPEPSSPLSSWSIPEPAASSNGAISGTSILTPSLSSDSCLSGRASSLELDTPRTTTLDSLFNASLGAEETTGSDGQGNDGLAFDARLGFILEGLYAVVEEPEPISVKGSRAVSRAESKAGSVIGRSSRPTSVFLNLDEKINEHGSIPDAAEPLLASAEAKPPKVPPKRVASASAAERKKSILNPFKRSNTTKPKVTVTSPSLTLGLADGGVGDVVEKRKRSLTLLKSVRRTVVSTFSPTSPSFAMAEGRKSFLSDDAASPPPPPPLPPSPSLRSRLMRGGAASPPPASAMLRSTTHSRQSSSASRGRRRRGRGRNSTFSSSTFSTSSSASASSSSAAAGSVNARQAVAPTMHNAASIVAHASKIEDEEMRRMTELAFLS